MRKYIISLLFFMGICTFSLFKSEQIQNKRIEVEALTTNTTQTTSTTTFILTTTKLLVQGVKGGARRQELSLNRVTLTDEKIDIPRNAKTQVVAKALVDNKVEEKIKKSKYGQKQELRKLRANLTDFDRFKVMRLRQKRAVLRHVATKGVAKKGGDKPSGAAKAQKPKKGGKK